ncbi:hypothetical protein BDF20DRAFT_876818 [Mycotypha africana]|uniref:uncharacterized protein n=1 Tax=Mycotypha africana TaxID=64632 RepID=UPI002301B910|nr:uncharacterized protein BDF20DRAFT_876818 [Mycotypha africana]KAI8975080.1 hypothetical protein BDF20DRAFT_876818 [Mycotypha africana]
MSDNNSEFDAVHSRTASDSSTTKLYTGIALNDYDDPYATKSPYNNNRKFRNSFNSPSPGSVMNNPTSTNNSSMNSSLNTLLSSHSQHDQLRANSYLPYSHHARDPNQKAEPIYIEEYSAPATTSLGVGSLLHDSMLDPYTQPHHQLNSSHGKTIDSKVSNDKDLHDEEALPEHLLKKRRRKQRKCCGLRLLTVGFISVVVTVIIVLVWYFVWPRIPSMTLDDVDNIGSIQVITNSTRKVMSTQWLLNLTADNSVNWVPTRIQALDIFITDDKTNQAFGNGSSGFFILPPKKKSIVTIPMTIFYASDNVNDTTFQDLYNACGVQVTSNTPFENLQDSLNVTLHLTYHISGIAWTYNRDIPYQGLLCPTS